MAIKETYRIDPDGELDYDGEEYVEDIEDVYQREWEMSTYNW